MATTYRLLSIDGGGIRGLIPALILAHLEQQTGRATRELFDGIAGTSTGALLAVGLAQGIPARALHQLYRQRGPDIFGERPADKLGTPPGFVQRALGLSPEWDLNDLWEPGYSDAGRHRLLTELFGTSRLRDLPCDVLIPTYDLELRCPVLLTSRLEANTASYEATCEMGVVDALMAATAAPTYFPPHRAPRADGGTYALVDGSIYATNPASLGNAFLAPQGRDVCLLSLGTGSQSHVYHYEDVRGWGLLSWSGPALKLLFDGQSTAVDLALSRRIRDYTRVQGTLGEAGASDELDDLRPGNLAALEQLAALLVRTHRGRLDALGARLLQNRITH